MSSKRKGVHPLAYPRRNSDSWRIRQRRRTSGTYPIEKNRVVDVPDLPETMIVTDGPSAWELDPYDAPTREQSIEELWRMLEIDADFAMADEKKKRR